jgi:hypothetical protein
MWQVLQSILRLGYSLASHWSVVPCWLWQGLAILHGEPGLVADRHAAGIETCVAANDAAVLVHVAGDAADALVGPVVARQRPAAESGLEDRAGQVAGLALLVAEVVGELADFGVGVGDGVV